MLLIVPWRDAGCPHRRAAAEHCLSLWSGEGWDVVLADAGGDLFSRADSINAAVAEHQPDVIVTADADLILSGLNEAVELALEAPGMVVPFNEGRYLSEVGSRQVFNGANPWLVEPQWRFWPDATTPLVGGANVLSAETFERVGGWPAGFAGWGWEDIAFANVCAEVAPIRRVEKPMVHLYHPKDQTYVAAADANRARLEMN